MRQRIALMSQLGPVLALLLPLGLWGMLWLSISPGSPAAILNPGSPSAFFHGLRAVFPLVAAGAAVVIIGIKVYQRSPRPFGFFGPLGLAVAYGLMGVVAVLKSPDGSVALWWVTLYLSVPIVLWGVAWNTDSLDRLRRLANATWLAMILAATSLFVVAAVYLNLVDVFLDPPQFLRCGSSGWFDLTSERLRDTGVGRYAAIAGILSISGLWQAKWRTVWIVVALISVILLLFTGARGAFLGFGAGATLVLLIYLIYSGKRAVLVGLLVTMVLGSVLWSTGTLGTFLDNCVFRGASPFTEQAPVFAAVPATSSDFQGDPEPTVHAPGDVLTTPVPGSDRPSTGEATTPAQAEVLRGPTTAADIPGVAEPTDPALAEGLTGPTTAADIPGVAEPTGPAPAEVLTGPTTAAVPQGAPKPTALAPTVVAPKGENPGSVPLNPGARIVRVEAPENPNRFFKLSGRTEVWAEGLRLFKDSPLIGYGFNADRLLLGTHMHNAVLHSLLQAGLLGAIPFIAAIILAWILFFRMVLKLAQLSGDHRHMVIQCGGVLAFLTMRSLPESTGAFFGVDWLILALVLFYLQVVNYGRQSLEVNSEHRILEGA